MYLDPTNLIDMILNSREVGIALAITISIMFILLIKWFYNYVEPDKSVDNSKLSHKETLELISEATNVFHLAQLAYKKGRESNE